MPRGAADATGVVDDGRVRPAGRAPLSNPRGAHSLDRHPGVRGSPCSAQCPEGPYGLPCERLPRPIRMESALLDPVPAGLRPEIWPAPQSPTTQLCCLRRWVPRQRQVVVRTVSGRAGCTVDPPFIPGGDASPAGVGSGHGCHGDEAAKPAAAGVPRPTLLSPVQVSLYQAQGDYWPAGTRGGLSPGAGCWAVAGPAPLPRHRVRASRQASSSSCGGARARGISRPSSNGLTWRPSATYWRRKGSRVSAAGHEVAGARSRRGGVARAPASPKTHPGKGTLRGVLVRV